MSPRRKNTWYVADACTAEFKPPRSANTPAEVAEVFRETVPEGEPREHFVGMYVNTRHRLLAVRVLSIGSLDVSIIHPRDVWRPAFELSAAAIIVAHNHPSGEATPSPEDIKITQRLVKAGVLLGVELIDHVVVGANGTWRSLRQMGYCQ